MKHFSAHAIGIALAILAAFGFAFKAILVKLAYPYGVAPVVLLALRMVFALPFFLWVGLRTSQRAAPVSRRDKLMLSVLGLLGYYGASILDFLGLQYISAGLERLILYTYPTLALLLGAVFYSRPVTRRQWMAVALCYLGIAMAFVHDLYPPADTGVAMADNTLVWTGAALVFGSAVCYAIYLAGSGDMITRIGAARFTALAMLVSTGGVFAHFLVSQSPSALAQPWPVQAYAFAMALFATVLPVFAQSAAIRRIGSGEAALVGMVGPLLTIVMAWLLLGEGISGAQMAGTVLVLGGIAIVSRAPDVRPPLVRHG